jgi:hypothetical protein
MATASLCPLILLGGCERDACKEYSRFTCNQLETQTFNVYYYEGASTSSEPNELFLGKAVGLQQCGALAWNTAEARKKAEAEDWSYVCCIQTDDSSCAEKHR